MRSERRPLSAETSEFARARVSAEQDLRVQQEHAARTVAEHAHDVDDLRGLLDMLGLEAGARV